MLFHAGASPIVTIPLDKQYVPVQRKNSVVAHKTAYFGRIFVGSPGTQAQPFTVVFDTGSGHAFLPSAACQTATCLKHRRYDRRRSSSFVDIDHDGTPISADAAERDQVAIAFGTGEVTGDFVRETVCLSNHANASAKQDASMTQKPADCTRVRLILATEMTPEPFEAFKFDGVLGLGLESLVVDPEFSFFGQMTKLSNLTEARFGYFLSQTDSVPSEISFGGHDERRVASELKWAPVHQPELGYWQVRIRSVTVGNEVLPLCEAGDCVAIADTGSSLLGVPRKAAQRMHWLLARKVPDEREELDCREFAGPEIVFDLGGFTVSLGPEDYSRPTAMKILQTKTNTSQVICRASLLPVDEGPGLPTKAFILGEPVLRKYYTAYDWRRKEMGFAPSVQPTAVDVAAAAQAQTHSVIGAPHAEASAPFVMSI